MRTYKLAQLFLRGRRLRHASAHRPPGAQHVIRRHGILSPFDWTIFCWPRLVTWPILGSGGGHRSRGLRRGRRLFLRRRGGRCGLRLGRRLLGRRLLRVRRLRVRLLGRPPLLLLSRRLLLLRGCLPRTLGRPAGRLLRLRLRGRPRRLRLLALRRAHLCRRSRRVGRVDLERPGRRSVARVHIIRTLRLMIPDRVPDAAVAIRDARRRLRRVCRCGGGQRQRESAGARHARRARPVRRACVAKRALGRRADGFGAAPPARHWRGRRCGRRTWRRGRVAAASRTADLKHTY